MRHEELIPIGLITAATLQGLWRLRLAQRAATRSARIFPQHDTAMNNVVWLTDYRANVGTRVAAT